VSVYFTSFVICVCGVELLIRAPLYTTLTTLLHYAAKSSRVIQSKHISDHWKEKVLPTYAVKVFQNSLKLFFIFLVVFAILLLISKALDLVNPAGMTTLEFLSTWTGILFATIASTTYYYARRFVLSR
jgi:hypothetical protein